jgi:hypothetical protein
MNDWLRHWWCLCERFDQIADSRKEWRRLGAVLETTALAARRNQGRRYPDV